jgi:hypothetical protein
LKSVISSISGKNGNKDGSPQGKEMSNVEKAFDLYMQLLDSKYVNITADANLNVAEVLENRGSAELACEFITNVSNIPQLRSDSVQRITALERRARLKEKQGKWRESLDDYLLLRDLKMQQDSTSTTSINYLEKISHLQRRIQEDHDTNQ